MTAILHCTCASRAALSFIFVPGLPQHIAMIPDPDDQSAQP
jgi:hypothetical protein